MRHILIVYFTLAVLPTPLSAAPCCPAEISATRSVASAVTTMNQSLVATLKVLGQAVTQQLVANNHSQLTAIQTQTKVFEQIMKTHAATLASQQAQRDFGTAGEITVNGRQVILSSRSPTLCDELAAARRAGMSAEKIAELNALLLADQAAHNRDVVSMNETAERMRRTETSSFDATWLGLDSLTEAEVLAANEQIKYLTNPLPLPALADDARATPAGGDYMEQRSLINSRIEVTQAALSENLAMRAPVLEDGEGKRSRLSEMQRRVDSTIDDVGDTAWLKRIEQKGIAALLRELNITAAHLYKLNLSQYRMDLQRNNLLAVLASHHNKGQADAVYNEYQHTLYDDK